MNHPTDTNACREFMDLSRRRFLGVGAAGIAAASIPNWLPNVALARDYRGAQRDVLVVVFLRGGADALTIVPPCFESNYYSSRPTLAIPRPDSASPYRALNLDDRFGFARAMQPLYPAYQDGRLLVVHAVGSRDYTRSHFEAARLMEIGVEDPAAPTGWLTRHLNNVPPVVGSTLRGIAISDGVPKSLAGAQRVLPIPDPANYNLRGDPITQATRANSIRSSFLGAPEPVRSYALNAYNTITLLNDLGFDSYQPAGGAQYPDSRGGRTMSAVACLTKAQVGVEVMTVELYSNNWDVHQAQNPFTGTMANEMDHLSRCLNAFQRDMFSGEAPSFTLVVMSEFGRTLYENASGGTDHGHGGMMLVMGNAVNGGRVLTDWPGLAVEQLYDRRDLEATFDYRDILGEILRTRVGNDHLDQVFPGYEPVFRGIYS